MSVHLIIVLLVFRIVLLLLLSLPLANLASVGLLAVQVGENQVKDFRVPAYSVAFDAFFDGLHQGEKTSLAQIQSNERRDSDIIHT
jgi:hypothetical protein